MFSCSFCGKFDNEVEALIIGPVAHNICNECIEICNYQIGQLIIQQWERMKKSDLDYQEEIIEGNN